MYTYKGIKPLRIFIGYDPREAVAYHVLAHSLLAHATTPISIAPLALHQLQKIGWDRPRDPLQSTDFSFTRFLVPWLCGFEGAALYMDCDMLNTSDITLLFQYIDIAPLNMSVALVKHEYEPAATEKFLGEPQTQYHHKNWSSLMLFNCAECQNLTFRAVAEMSGLALHQFEWTHRTQIFGISPEWNTLVTSETPPNWFLLPVPKVLHWTEGGPWLAKFKHAPWASHWRRAYFDMIRS